MQPGERVICEIKRHPAGMLGIYSMAGVVLVVLAVLMLVIIPNGLGSGAAEAVGTVIFMLVACLVIGFVFVANKIYLGNSWVVSSDSLTQINQASLFSKKSSQLSLGNMENVVAEQHGVLAQIFKFGTLKIETAGEHNVFTFPHCPTPNYYAQKILAAREAFEQTHNNQEQVETMATGSMPQPQAQPPSPTPQTPPVAPPVFPDTTYDNQRNDTYSG
jgi:uncharacterized membrane protein YdbT with pleckstrin-like domain